jgi:hypothetical protein
MRGSHFQRRRKTAKAETGCLPLPLFSLSAVATSFLQQKRFASTTCEQEKQLWAAAAVPLLASNSTKACVKACAKVRAKGCAKLRAKLCAKLHIELCAKSRQCQLSCKSQQSQQRQASRSQAAEFAPEFCV